MRDRQYQYLGLSKEHIAAILAMESGSYLVQQHQSDGIDGKIRRVTTLVFALPH